MKKQLIAVAAIALLALPGLPVRAELPADGTQLAQNLNDLSDFRDVLKLIQNIDLRQVERRSQKEFRSHIEQREAINSPLQPVKAPAPIRQKGPNGRILRK